MQNEKIQNFLSELQMINPDWYHIIDEIRALILKTYPEAREKFMYGGITFFSNEEMFSGVFSNKKHISLEFSTGFQMKDPNGNLEGKGKFRRHLKIRSKEDIQIKEVAFYVHQAI